MEKKFTIGFCFTRVVFSSNMLSEDYLSVKMGVLEIEDGDDKIIDISFWNIRTLMIRTACPSSVTFHHQTLVQVWFFKKLIE